MNHAILSVTRSCSDNKESTDLQVWKRFIIQNLCRLCLVVCEGHVKGYAPHPPRFHNGPYVKRLLHNEILEFAKANAPHRYTLKSDLSFYTLFTTILTLSLHFLKGFLVFPFYNHTLIEFVHFLSLLLFTIEHTLIKY